MKAKSTSAPDFKKRIPDIKKSWIILLALFILAILPGYYFYNQYQKAQDLLQNADQPANKEVEKLIAKVGNLIELPKNETPTVATVSDKTKLADQPFFANALNGDKVLIYSQAKKAILYRPRINKIIQVSSVSVDASGSAQTTTDKGVTPTLKSVSITIYNGTTTTGLARSAGSKITAQNPSFKVSSADATGKDYEKTLIIDLTGKNSKEVGNLALLLNGETESNIPEGETKPNSDILIIVGTDFSGE